MNMPYPMPYPVGKCLPYGVRILPILYNFASIVASYYLSQGKNNYVTLGLRLFWKYKQK